MSTPDRQYEIHEVSQLTGLEPARLRAWERRYDVVRPVRQPNGYRAYSAEQVALLRSYARLISGGERIGDLVARPVEEVIARAEGRELDGSPFGAMLDAIKAFDRERLESAVAQQLSLRGLSGFARVVVIPLSQAVGDLWALGKLPVSAEHLASEVVVHALKGGLRFARSNGPLVLGAGIPGERHEWGILSALTGAQELGWQVHYLGPDLPLDDMLEAAWKLRPALIALSVADPALAERRAGGLASLPSRLPPGASLAIGGAGAEPLDRMFQGLGFRTGDAAFEVH